MSKRFELINFLNAHDDFKDNKKNEKLDSFDVVRLLNHYDELQTLLVEKDQRIAELEEQLKGCIRPKFKKGQMVYSPLDLQDIYKGQIDVFDYYAQKYWVFFGDDIGCEWCCESELFKTKKEAQAKLEELIGE